MMAPTAAIASSPLVEHLLAQHAPRAAARLVRLSRPLTRSAGAPRSFNRHYAEPSGYYYSQGRTFVQEMSATEVPITFHDAVDGKPLFVAPLGRSGKDFLKESHTHGWPSFRNDEVVWENVRCLPDGEVISTTGTHLGHNIPDEKGHRFCINVSRIE